MRIHSMVLLSILAFASMRVLPVYAQPSGKQDNPKKELKGLSADELFERAQTASKAGDSQGAYDAYLAAWRIEKSYDIAGNLGSVEMKLGKIPDAAAHFTYALQNFPPSGPPAQRTKLADRLADARSKVAILRVVADHPNATITLDGAPLGEALIESEVFVSPGSHTIEAKLSGYRNARQEITVLQGSSQAVALTLVALPLPRLEDPFAISDHAAATPTAVTPPTNSANHQVLATGSLVASGVVAVTGVVLLAVSASLNSNAAEVQAQAGRSGCFRPSAMNVDACDYLKSTISDRNTTANLGIAALAVGIAGASASLTYILWPRGSAAATPAQVTALPAWSLTSGGLSVAGLW